MSSDTVVAQDDPFKVLGIPIDATEEEVRSRYLELVKKFPPEREPEQFRKIQAAYEAARDPIELASRLIDATSSDDVPSWQSALERFAAQPPRSSLSFLMSLGNQVAGYSQSSNSQSSNSQSSNSQSSNSQSSNSQSSNSQSSNSQSSTTP